MSGGGERRGPAGLPALATPSLVLDAGKLGANIERMRRRLAALGVPLRPHVKTSKCLQVVRRALDGQPGGVTVSTLREAAEMLAAGIDDILYGVGIAPQKLEEVARLRQLGARLAIVLDSVEQADAVAARAASLGTVFDVLLEIDCDGHRSGIAPDSARLIEVAGRANVPGRSNLRGVMTHAGESYACAGTAEIAALADREAAAVRDAAARLRAAGLPSPVVSVGSTPTATFARRIDGVTEVRAGVYMFQDLVMAGLGVCEVADIAVSVLATVIGHQRERDWVIVDAGWMSLSRDRGTARQQVDQGYGVVCSQSGEPLDDLIVADANQEHGIIRSRAGGRRACDMLAVGDRVRILPNHACATAAAHEGYWVLDGAAAPACWPRFRGW